MLKKAREDNDIKAIIIRINSPGGSVLTSEEIRTEIVRTRETKPVYASMSDVAASGGYYIAMDCDTIIAHPTTITGSVGVLSLLPIVSGLYDNIYISVDTISTGPASNYFTGITPYTDKEKEKIHVIVKGVYYRFLTKVSKSP